MKIKVCGLKYPENIEQIIESKPDFLGFIFYKKSKRLINQQTIEFLNNHQGEIKKVGVFVNHELEEVYKIMKEYKLDFAQLHGDETPNYVAELFSRGISIIKAIQINNEFDWNSLRAYEPFVDYFLFDTASENYGGSGNQFDWELLKNYKGSDPFFLSGGIGLKNVESIKKLKLPKLYAVDINSQVELEAGLKDPTLVNQFINRLRKKYVSSK